MALSSMSWSCKPPRGFVMRVITQCDRDRICLTFSAHLAVPWSRLGPLGLHAPQNRNRLSLVATPWPRWLLTVIELDRVGVNAALLRRTCAACPAGATVSMCGAVAGHPFGMAVSSFTRVSLHAPMREICVQSHSTTWPALRSPGRLGVNTLASGQDWLGRQVRVGAERFSAAQWQVTRSGAVVAIKKTGRARIDASAAHSYSRQRFSAAPVTAATTRSWSGPRRDKPAGVRQHAVRTPLLPGDVFHRPCSPKEK